MEKMVEVNEEEEEDVMIQFFLNIKSEDVKDH